MTIRRRTATPTFQKPLTTAEAEGKQVTRPTPKYVTCRLCGSSGGTLVKVKDTAPTEYECQDKGKCKVMKLRRRK